MKQVLFAVPTSPAVSTQYNGLQTTGGWNGTEVSIRHPWSAPGVFRNLVVEVATAPGAGTSRTFTLRKNAAGTALTVTISDTATTARLTGTDVTVAAGDLLALQQTVSGSPVAAIPRWSLEFEGSTAKESSYGANIGLVASGGGTKSCGPFFGGQTSATATDVRQTVAAAGTLTRSDLYVSSAPAAGNGLTSYVNLNGVRQDGTGGTVTTTCALTSGVITASSTYSLPLVAGDLVYFELVPSGTYTARLWGVGCAFTATTDGQSQLCGSTLGTAVSNSVTGYWAAVAGAGAGGTSATETDFAARLLPGVTTVYFSGLRVALTVAPGSGKNRLVDLRVSAASTSLTTTISDSATTGSDLTHTASVADGSDRWNLRTVPTGTPATTVLLWSLIQSAVAPAAAEGVTTYVWLPE